ncbi:hypothetical protein H4S04_004459 [Coemansia sp. S16]|nr:hypothetical protein H4S04_004459 [Coemansia sp. S16]
MLDRAGVSAAIKKRYGAVLQAQWLEKCATYIEQELGEHEEAAGSRKLMHLETQVRLVAEQLVHSEISDSCHPSLVVEAGSQQVKRLPENPGAFLQVQSVVEVGVSKYAMWEAAREKEDFEQRGIRPSYLPQLTDEDESGSGEANSTAGTQAQTQPPTQAEASGDRHPKIPHKMLKLVLTDGRRQVSALEVEPIVQLSAELAIGSKVVVTNAQILEGTGVLCLRGGNIRVVGGEPAHGAALDSSEKQKKILAAKKKLKSFQAKRAAASEPPTASAAEEEAAVPEEEEGSGRAAAKDDEADVLSKELEQLKVQINGQREQLQEENRTTRAELVGCQARLAALIESAAATEQGLQEQVATLGRDLQAMTERATASEAQHAQEKKDLEDNIQQLESAVATGAAALADTQAALVGSQAGLAEAQAQHKQEKASLDDKVQQLEFDVSAGVAALSSAQTQHAQEKSRLESDISSVQAELADSQAQLGQALATGAASQAQAAELEQALATASADGAAKQRRVDDLEANLAHEAHVRSNIQAKHDSLAAALKEARADIDRLSSEVAEAGRALQTEQALKDDALGQSAAQAQAHASERAALEAASAKLAQQLDDETHTCADVRLALQAEQARAQARDVELTQQLEQEHTARTEAEAAHAQALAAMAELEERNNKLAEDLQIDAQAARETFEELMQEHHDLERRHARLTATHARLADNHLRAIASTQAWLTELQEAATRHQVEAASWAEPSAEPNDGAGDGNEADTLSKPAAPAAQQQQQRKQQRQQRRQ